MCLRNSIFSVQVSSVDIRVYPVSHIKNCSSNPKKNGNKKGLVLFGSHTTAEKVSIEKENFRSIQVKNLKDLNPSTVFEKIKENLN